MIEAIIFDLDGVICSTDQYHYKAWKNLADELNIPFDEKDNERLRGVSRMESLDIILEKSSKKYSDDEKLSFAQKKNIIYRQYLNQMTTKDLQEEVKETLNELRKMGFKLAIGSSSKNTMLILKQIGLETFFDAICDGTMIAYSKPHPEVFMKAADLLKVNYKNCLVVEDAVAGCIAAKSASMQVAAIASAYGSNFADYHLNCFRDLITVLNIAKINNSHI